MASHIEKCEARPSAEADPKKVTDTPWYKAEFESSSAKALEVKHKVEVGWFYLGYICFLHLFSSQIEKTL